MKKFLLILLASALLMGCGSTKHLPEVQVVSHTIHDTLYTTQIAYDSIYVNNWQYLDRSTDTIYLEKVKQEFRYKYLHDTIRVVKVDSIPVIKTVTEIQQVKYTPWYAKTFAWIGVLSILFLILLTLKKIYLK